MDYGDDPVLGIKYDAVHARAAHALKPEQASRLQTLKNRREWSKMSLDELSNKCISAEMCVAAGLKWNALVKKYGTAELIAFGFRWPAMLEAGFCGAHLRQLSKSQLSYLGVNAVRALECRPHISDVAALGLSAHELHQLGWTLPMLKNIGLSMQSMVDFGIPLQHWAAEFGMVDFQSYGFTSPLACATAGWSQDDIKLALSRPALPSSAVQFPAQLQL